MKELYLTVSLAPEGLRDDLVELMASAVRAAEPRPSDQRQLLLAAMLVESSDDAIIGEDQHGVITTWNPAAQRLYGYTPAEVVGRTVSFLLPPDRLDELDAVLGRVAKGGNAHHYETKRISKDGTLIDVGMTVSPIRDLDGSINHAGFGGAL